MHPIRIFIADDHAVLLEGLVALAESTEDLELVGTAMDGDEAVRQVLATRPDVAVLDVRMPGCDGIEATRRILAECPDVRILLMAGADGSTTAYAAFREGASGFLPKGSPSHSLVQAIREVAMGQIVAPPDLMAGVISQIQPRDRGLDPRTRRILELVAEGATNEQIAHSLGVSVGTVKMDLSELFKEFSARDRASLVAEAFRRGVLS